MAKYNGVTYDYNKPKAIIAGGGLAGLACAKRLTDAGYRVELVEAEPQLGGRTASWTDEDGKKIESGIHTFFGAYSRLTRLLKEVGTSVDDILQWDKQIGILQPQARLHMFGIDPVRNLTGLVSSIIGNNDLLGPIDKITFAATFINGLLRLERYEPITVSQLARKGGLDRRTYKRLIRPLARGLAFSEPEELSAYVLLRLLTHAIGNPLNLRAGTFAGGMTEVMITPIADWLETNGATLRTNTPLKAIHHEGRAGAGLGKITGFELENGEILTGDVYVSALPLEVFQVMIPRPLENILYFQHIKNLETVPALAVQLWFDKSFVKRTEFIILANSPVIVIQDEAHLTFPHHGSRISLQVTDRSKDHYDDQQLIDLSLRELHRYIPSSRHAKLEKAVVVRHRAINIKPGVHFLRPQQASPISNFFLAGDYTRQNWFTTMEGATQSGEMAAAAIVRRHHHPNYRMVAAHARPLPVTERIREIEVIAR